ncbi:antigen WC1.1-like [Macrobrachium nipponense]|uniref:antigen WC1.1-like n=1 Tax=Macrobrachium nipponense TaxID=159736 RepID=UPI0030C7E368
MDLGLRWSLLVLVFHLSFNLPVQSQRPLLDRKVAAVHLVGGERPTEGNILVTSEAGGEGRPLCDDFFGMTEANTVCRALGYPGALRFTRRNFYGGHTQRWTPDDWKDLYVLECPEETGNDNVDLTSCTLNSNTQYCTGAEVAGVECQTESAKLCSSNQFTCEKTSSGTTSDSSCISEYLVCNGFQDCMDGSDEKPELCEEDVFRLESVIPTKIPGNSAAGTVYMKHNGTWSSVCDDLFGRQEARVICQNLGYGSGMSIPYTRAYFGVAAADIGVDNLECTGEENSLSSCPGFLWGESDCAHAEDAGVFCHDGVKVVQSF